jgi:rod shape-determining protein MreC
MLDNIQRTATGARPRTGLLFLAFVVGHIILISSQVQSRTGVPVLEGVTFGVFSRVQQATANAIRFVRNGFGSYVDLRNVQRENEALRSRVADLEVRLQEQRAQALRADRLQSLLALKPSVGVPTLAAEVIAGYANPGILTVTIDKGTTDGVQENMAVIAPVGVVGRVISPVASSAARVQLLVDQHAAAGAVIERSRAGGMVIGRDGEPTLRMELVSNLADVQVGDLVVSSGADGIYPRGFTIGWVERAERGEGLYKSITVRPAVDFRGLEDVLVVLRPARAAIPEETGEPSAGPAR